MSPFRRSLLLFCDGVATVKRRGGAGSRVGWGRLYVGKKINILTFQLKRRAWPFPFYNTVGEGAYKLISSLPVSRLPYIPIHMNRDLPLRTIVAKFCTWVRQN